MMKNNYKGYEDWFYIMVGVIYYHIVPDALPCYHYYFLNWLGKYDRLKFQATPKSNL